MSDPKPVTIRILGNEYHVSSPEDEIPQLEAAARDLDQRMREIKASGIVGVERIAVMAALNMAYELGKGGSQDFEKIESRINQLRDNIESALATSAQMELT